VPPDGRHGVIEEDGTSFAWQSPHGVRYRYREDPTDPRFHRIREIRDRFGNTLTFSYQDDCLQRVDINHPDRYVTFTSDAAGRIIG